MQQLKMQLRMTINAILDAAGARARHDRGRGDGADDGARAPGGGRGGRQVAAGAAHLDAALDVLRRLPRGVPRSAASRGGAAGDSRPRRHDADARARLAAAAPPAHAAGLWARVSRRRDRGTAWALRRPTRTDSARRRCRPVADGPSRRRGVRDPRRQAIPPDHRRRSDTVASIEAVGAREILDSRGNPTVEVEVALDDGTIAPRRRPVRRLHRRLRGRRAARRRQGPLPRQGRAEGRRRRHRRDRPRAASASTPTEQRLIDQAMIDLRRHRQQAQARRQRHPRRLPRRRQGRRRLRRPAAVPLPRRPERARPARADDEHPQRRRARRLQRRHPGVHDRADRRRDLPEALRWGAEVYHALKGVLKERGPGHRPRRRGRLRPRTCRSNRAALDLIVEAIEKAGYTPGQRHRARARRRRDRVLRGRRLRLRGQAAAPPTR